MWPAWCEFASHFNRSPAELNAEHIRAYQIHLLNQHVTWSLFNQTVCTLRFLYGTTLGKPGLVPFIPYGWRNGRFYPEC